MFPRRRVVRIPGLDGRRPCPEVVDVPMRPGREAQVVTQTGPHAARPESAANVDVEPYAEREVTEPADPDARIAIRPENERIGPVLTAHGRHDSWAPSAARSPPRLKSRAPGMWWECWRHDRSDDIATHDTEAPPIEGVQRACRTAPRRRS